MATQPVTLDEAQTLSPDIKFELIPECPAATAAGYTAATRAAAQVWYPPVVNGDFFYYTAWSGSILAPNHLSTILVCRRVSNGALVYARNTAEYSLDTAPNYMGDKNVICRTKLFILGDSIYLCNSVISNLGPMLFCVNVANGNLRWAAAYYPPEGAPSRYITTKGNYSYLAGSNNRLGDLSPTGGYFTDKDGIRRKLIFVGSSSFQNAVNTNMFTGGFPIYTDQGQCVCIEDLNTSSRLYWITNTCAPSPKLGDVLQKGGPAHLDPFRPTEDKVVVFSVTSTTNNFLQPYYLTNQGANPDAVTPIVANVVFNKSTVIDLNLVQKIWSFVPKVYEDGDRTTSYKIDQLINIWKQEQLEMPAGAVKKHLIWSYVPSSIIQQAITQKVNTGIGYFKFLKNGQKLEHAADVSGLGYWGNSTWGAPPTIVADKNLVVFGTGQGHDIVQDESLYYSQPSLNFKEQKKSMLDVIDRFITGNTTLPNVSLAKSSFVQMNSLEALNSEAKAPRGRMSYSDGVMACYIVSKNMAGREVQAGEISFALRSVAWDNYSFLTDNPKAAIYPIPALDADASSGVHYYSGFIRSGVKQDLLSTPTKGGIALTIDITNIDESVPFDHNNLSAKKVVVSSNIYNGPDATLGGANYMSAAKGSIVVSCQMNTSGLGGSTSTTGILERQVSPTGKVVPINDSYVQAYDMSQGKILWETSLSNRSVSEISISGDVVYLGDFEGNLYCFKLTSGRMLWKYNGKKEGLMGGITCPAFSNKSVIWTNNYNAFGVGGAWGPNGVIFKPSAALAITPLDKPSDFLNGKSFVSWDSAPKVTPNPAINPSIIIHVDQNWFLEYSSSCCGCDSLICVTKVNKDGIINYYRMVVDSYNPETMALTLKGEGCSEPFLRNAKIVFFNKSSYTFEYSDPVTGEKVTAWLEPKMM